MSQEEQRYSHLLSFMTEFRSSMEKNISKTNDKLDAKLEEIGVEVKEIHEKIDKNEDKAKEAMLRMDDRLKELENEMKKASVRNVRRDELVKQAEKMNKLREAEKEERMILEKNKDDEKMKAKMNWRKANPEVKEKEAPEKERKKKKTFQRRMINEGDLMKEIVVENESAVEEVTGSYRSSWAKQLESELAGAASIESRVWIVEDSEQMKENEDILRKDDNVWRRLGMDEKVKNKVRKPIIVKDWFGMESSSDSDTSNPEDSDWSEVERQAKNRKKMKDRKTRRKEKISQIARRMKLMIGLGPIPKATRDYFDRKTSNKKEATAKCVKEYLKYYLDFDDEELEKIQIEDSKLAANDDVIYVALSNEEQVREIYRRKAFSENDDLILRDYIPPQFHSRYMAIAAKAKEVRANDNTIKTQIRWGNNDIEIFTRLKGSEEAFKKMDLLEFMDKTTLPDFDDTVKWKNRENNLFKRKTTIGRERLQLPSLMNGNNEGPSLTRKHSRGGREEPAKKKREEDPLANIEMEEMVTGDSTNDKEDDEYL